MGSAGSPVDGIVPEVKHCLKNCRGVVVIMGLAASEDVTPVALRGNTMPGLEGKFGHEELANHPRQHDVSGTPEALTKEQAKEMLLLKNADIL